MLLGLALLLRVLLIAWLYSPSLLRFDNGDYPLYLIGAQEIAAHGLDFSNSLFMVRPPLYPLLIALLGLQAPLVLAANVALGLLLVVVTYKLALAFGLKQREAFLAAALVAFDPASIQHSTTLLAEPLANLLLGVAILCLLYALKSFNNFRSIHWGILAGLALAASALARPAAFILWLPLGIVILASQRQAARATLAFMGVAALICGSWTLHNATFFDNANFSTIGVYNMLYYRAASVERIGNGSEINSVYLDLSRRVEEKLGHDTALVDDNTRHTHYSTDGATQAAMTQVALEVFREYPVVYLATVPLGLFRMLFRTENLPTLIVPLDILWNSLFLLLTMGGLALTAYRRQGLHFWLVVVLGVYFIGGTLAVQTSGIDTRGRSMLAPFMACMAVIALQALYERYRQRRNIDM